MAFKLATGHFLVSFYLNSHYHLTLFTSPFLKFFLLYLDSTIFLFSLLLSELSFKCAIPKYSLWPLPSNYVYLLSNFCSLTNSRLSFKGHEVHLGSLPSFDAPAWHWTTHDYYSPLRSHILMYKFRRKPQWIRIFH